MIWAGEAADGIVVGAGHNGLVAANPLADAGWQVLVLEAAASPGGAVHTEEVTAPGFRDDLSSAFFPMTALSPVIAGLDPGAPRRQVRRRLRPNRRLRAARDLRLTPWTWKQP